MMQGKLDLGLSLSLNTSQSNHIAIQNSTPSLPFPIHQRSHLSNPLSSQEKRIEHVQRPLLNVIDVNCAIKALEDDEGEDEGASSSPSTLSSVSGGGKRSERDGIKVPMSSPLERTSSRGTSDEEDGEICRKKLRLSKDQSAVLEEFFKDHNTLNPKQKMALAKQLTLRPRQVEVWFQNRRARTKLKQTEVDCEYLKRWCEKLNEENKKLQKELTELRAIKMLSPYHHFQSQQLINSMCPSCQRLSPSNSFNSNTTNVSISSSSPSAKHHIHHQNHFPVVAHSIRNAWPVTAVDTAYHT